VISSSWLVLCGPHEALNSAGASWLCTCGRRDRSRAGVDRCRAAHSRLTLVAIQNVPLHATPMSPGPPPQASVVPPDTGTCGAISSKTMPVTVNSPPAT